MGDMMSDFNVETLWFLADNGILYKDAWKDEAWKVYDIMYEAIRSYSEAKNLGEGWIDYADYILSGVAHIVWEDLNFDTKSLDWMVDNILTNKSYDNIDLVIKNIVLSSVYVLKAFPPYEKSQDYKDD